MALISRSLLDEAGGHRGEDLEDIAAFPGPDRGWGQTSVTIREQEGGTCKALRAHQRRAGTPPRCVLFWGGGGHRCRRGLHRLRYAGGSREGHPGCHRAGGKPWPNGIIVMISPRTGPATMWWGGAAASSTSGGWAPRALWAPYTGVLPVFVGRATRAVEFTSESGKEYIAGLKLGIITDTQDTTGTVLEQRPVQTGREQLEGGPGGVPGRDPPDPSHVLRPESEGAEA